MRLGTHINSRHHSRSALQYQWSLGRKSGSPSVLERPQPVISTPVQARTLQSCSLPFQAPYQLKAAPPARVVASAREDAYFQ